MKLINRNERNRRKSDKSEYTLNSLALELCEMFYACKKQTYQ